jgi:Domain of unknown function (DUF4157)
MSNQKALARKSTLTNTETQENQFEGRGFAVQKKSDIQTQKSDLNTQLKQAKSFGHSITKLAGQQSSSASPQTNGLSIQAKLSIGEPGDKYEQEADRVASEVVQRINAPSSTGESVQREGIDDEEELQMKPLADSIQRVENEDEELQMKPLADSIQREGIDDEEELQMKTQVQRREAIGGGEASEDLETAINSAKGGGQSLDAGLQRSIGEAMGADFSGVKVHTDAQADQLNQSIQAKAFTTGQDLFFRQGAYEPGSRGGQELIAHELTHVAQQSRGQSLDAGLQRSIGQSMDTTSALIGLATLAVGWVYYCLSNDAKIRKEQYTKVIANIPNVAEEIFTAARNANGGEVDGELMSMVAQGALLERNKQMESVREQISLIGLKLSEYMKSKGKTYEELYDKYNTGEENAEVVNQKIISAAGRANKDLLAKFLGS